VHYTYKRGEWIEGTGLQEWMGEDFEKYAKKHGFDAWYSGKDSLMTVDRISAYRDMSVPRYLFHVALWGNRTMVVLCPDTESMSMFKHESLAQKALEFFGGQQS
jgi:hypothetical protein